MPSELRPKSTLSPEIREETPGSAEILVGSQFIQVTVPLPSLADGDVDLVITRSSIRVRSKSDASAPSYLVPLPVTVQPDRYVLHHANGLLDFTIERASR